MENKTSRRGRGWPRGFFVLLPLAVGGASALLTREGMALFALMRKPPLTPPGWLFPAVWSVLYVLMGLASYLVFASPASEIRKKRALSFYAVQLGMNFFWPVIFFRLEMLLTAFVWLLGMWGLLALCALLFWHIDRRAGALLLPCLLWTAFAAYLNLGVYLLN